MTEEVVSIEDLESLRRDLTELMETSHRICESHSAGHEPASDDRKIVNTLRTRLHEGDKLPAMLMRRSKIIADIEKTFRLLEECTPARRGESVTILDEISGPLRETAEWLERVVERLRESTLADELAVAINILETRHFRALTQFLWESVEWMNVTVVNLLALQNGLGNIFVAEYETDGSQSLTIRDPNNVLPVVFRFPSRQSHPWSYAADVSDPKVKRATGFLRAWQRQAVERPVNPTDEHDWPDPEEHTRAKVWTRKDGTLYLSTKTDTVHDGKVTFAPNATGQLTYQMRFMQLMCFKFPDSATVAEVIEQVYPDDLTASKQDPDIRKKTLHKLRALVSDVRTKKFAKAGLNPDVLPPLSIEASIEAGIGLRLAHLTRLDDKELDGADAAPE